MAARIAEIWRHPLKSHGREALARTTLSAGAALPFDRSWAVTHEDSRFDPARPAWAPCANFSIGSKNPALMAITARLDEEARRLTLSHPEREDIAFCPDARADVWRFLDWLEPLVDPARARPTGIVSAAGRAMTDSEYPSVSILSLDTLAALSEAAGQTLSPARFRGNIWLSGLPPWAEFDLVGKEITLGAARLVVRERIRRCRATTADPETGRITFDTLSLLNQRWGHQDFGVYAEVIEGGAVRLGDEMQGAYPQ